MKLTAAMAAVARGPVGIWLNDETGDWRMTISFDGHKISRKQVEYVAAAIANLIPEEGIEVPDNI